MTAPPLSRSVPPTRHYSKDPQDSIEEAPNSPIILDKEKKEGPYTPPVVYSIPAVVPILALVSIESDSPPSEPLSDDQRSHRSYLLTSQTQLAQRATTQDDLHQVHTLPSTVSNASGKKSLAGAPKAPPPSTMGISLASPKRSFSSKSNRAKLSFDSKKSDHSYELTKHTSPVQNAATIYNEADRIVYREFFNTLKKMIDKLKDRQVSNDKEVAKINKRIVPRLVRQIELADRWLLSGTLNGTKDVLPAFIVVSGPHSKLSDSEIEDTMQDLEGSMDQIIEQSRTESVTKASSNIVNRLTPILNQLIDEYRTLQIKAQKDIEKDVASLFSKYQFTMLRNCFYMLSQLSADQEKKISLSYLIRCLENDPIHTVTENGLLVLMDNVVNYLNELNKNSNSFSSTSSSSTTATAQQADMKETTKSFLEILTLISEVWAWHNENVPKMKLENELIGRAREVIDAIIANNHPKIAIEEYNYSVWDMRLQCNIAKEALHNLTIDRSKLEILFEVVSPIAKNFASSGDIISAVEGAFKALNSAFGNKQEKMTHCKWYLNLFAVRKIVYMMIHDSDKVKFLQASLTLPSSDGVTWEFTAGVIHLLARLCFRQDQQLRNIICAGQKTTKSPPGELPGLVHLCDRKMYAYYSEHCQTYLAQLAKSYGLAIAKLLGTEEEQKLKALYSAEVVMTH